jgi:Ca-activated chloride channel family protein
MTLTLRTDRRLIRAEASSTRYLLASITSPSTTQRVERLPIHVALVLDRSGSMADERKFSLAREAVQQALQLLHAEDRFSLVVFDTEVDVLSLSALATPDAKRRALDALAATNPRGSTDLCAGWLRGCEQVAEHLDDDSISRVLLLTDGLANAGVTDHATLVHHATELRRRGIATTTFGVGADFDERLLRDLAHEGGGNFYFLATAQQIPELLRSEMGEVLEVTVRHCALELHLPPGVDLEPLHRFRVEHEPITSVTRVELGDLVARQELQVVLRLRFPRGEIGHTIAVRGTVTGDGVLGDGWSADAEWQFASHRENDQQPRDHAVDRAVASIYVARARAEATEANRHHDWRRAGEVLERTARRIEQYAGADTTLHSLVAELRGDVHQFAERPMSAMELKQSFFQAEAPMKSRTVDGRAQR